MLQVLNTFRYFPLKLVEPDFSDPLTDLIIELDHQRKYLLQGTTPPELFFQIKRFFHLLESLGSARIENNRTTVAELIEYELESQQDTDSQYQEILNIEQTMSFIESQMTEEGFNAPLGHGLIREIHRHVTSGLPVTGEGDKTPGEYRKSDVQIARSDHSPPPCSDVFPLMDELVQFLKQPDSAKYDLIKIALAHHRFAWLHPFSNGNGRTVRLMTYAMLLQAGFRVGGMTHVTRLLNPTAVFCSDRDLYYTKLAQADTGKEEGLLDWCRYVLEGLQQELQKIDKLLDYAYLQSKILRPAIQELHRKNGLSDHEYKILLYAISHDGPIQNKDIRALLDSIGQVQVSRILSEMKDRNLLIPPKDAERKYMINLDKSPLMRDIIRQLDKNGFLPIRGEI